MANKKVVLAGVGIAFATIVIIGSILAGALFPKILINKLHDALVVDKAQPKEERFQHWENSNYDGAAPYYKVFTLFNLTNFNEVQAVGAKPIYESVGPYYYRKYQTKLNYTFFDDGKKVSYKTYEPLFYEPSLGNSGLDPLTDVIYNINPTYVGLIVGAGGEKNLIQALVPPTWMGIMDAINSPSGYLGLVLDQYYMQYLYMAEKTLLAQIAGDQQTAFAEFLSIWANATEDPTDISGFNSTMRLSVNGISSDISFSSASMLFDPSQPLSLLSSNPKGFHVWFGAEQGNPNATDALKASFFLSDDQLNLIIEWRNRFKPTYYGSLSALFGVANVSDLGYYQWGMGNVTAVDIKHYIQPVQIPQTPEFAMWSNTTLADPIFFSVEQTKRFLTGPASLFNQTNYFTFLFLWNTGNWDAISATWGLNQMQATYLNGYIQAVIAKVYVMGSLQMAFAAGSGLVTRRTVDEWLWSGVDPLLSKISPAHAGSHLFSNDTSEAEALENNKASTYWTGKGDLNKVVQYIDYEGSSTINIWATPKPVGGTDASQFPPGVSKSDTLQAYVSDLARIVDIKFQKKVEFKGIDLYRFTIADYMLDINADFYQSITGFANISSANSGAPIFLSKPNFLDCEEYWANQVDGVEPSSEYDTFIDVEPMSGLTMQVHKKLQLNVYYENSTSWTSLFSVFNPNMKSGLFYPVVWVDETSSATDKQAEEFKNSVLNPLHAFRISFYVGMTVGAVLLIAFIAIMVYLVKFQKPDGYKYLPLDSAL